MKAKLFIPILALSLAAFSCSAATKRVPPTNVSPANFPPAPADPPGLTGLQTAIFAGGCFWGVQAVFENIRGVESAISGYAGGSTANPTYHEVSSGATGHAEAVKVTWDPKIVSFGQLLQVFFSVVHDPTQLNFQGPDRGTQYRSALFYAASYQKDEANAYIAALKDAKAWPGAIVTQMAAAGAFWEAEAYHQGYLRMHPDQPYIVAWDLPKLDALAATWPALVKGSATSFWRGYPALGEKDPYPYPVVKSEAEWRAQLKGRAYGILREEETEYAFSGEYLDEHRAGTYYSAATGQPLFRSEDKFDSRTGWPSFTRPIDQSALILRIDRSHGLLRIEVEDSSSGSHLGHVFEDGPEPTGLRYCINSASLLFVPDGSPLPPLVAGYKP